MPRTRSTAMRIAVRLVAPLVLALAVVGGSAPVALADPCNACDKPGPRSEAGAKTEKHPI